MSDGLLKCAYIPIQEDDDDDEAERERGAFWIGRKRELWNRRRGLEERREREKARYRCVRAHLYLHIPMAHAARGYLRDLR